MNTIMKVKRGTTAEWALGPELIKFEESSVKDKDSVYRAEGTDLEMYVYTTSANEWYLPGQNFNDPTAGTDGKIAGLPITLNDFRFKGHQTPYCLKVDFEGPEDCILSMTGGSGGVFEPAYPYVDKNYLGDFTPRFFLKWPAEKVGVVEPELVKIRISLREINAYEELAPGQLGLEYTVDGSVKLKAGTKTESKWNKLPYIGGEESIVRNDNEGKISQILYQPTIGYTGNVEFDLVNATGNKGETTSMGYGHDFYVWIYSDAYSTLGDYCGVDLLTKDDNFLAKYCTDPLRNYTLTMNFSSAWFSAQSVCSINIKKIDTDEIVQRYNISYTQPSVASLKIQYNPNDNVYLEMYATWPEVHNSTVHAGIYFTLETDYVETFAPGQLLYNTDTQQLRIGTGGQYDTTLQIVPTVDQNFNNKTSKNPISTAAVEARATQSETRITNLENRPILPLKPNPGDYTEYTEQGWTNTPIANIKKTGTIINFWDKNRYTWPVAFSHPNPDAEVTIVYGNWLPQPDSARIEPLEERVYNLGFLCPPGAYILHFTEVVGGDASRIQFQALRDSQIVVDKAVQLTNFRTTIEVNQSFDTIVIIPQNGPLLSGGGYLNFYAGSETTEQRPCDNSRTILKQPAREMVIGNRHIPVSAFMSDFSTFTAIQQNPTHLYETTYLAEGQILQADTGGWKPVTPTISTFKASSIVLNNPDFKDRYLHVESKNAEYFYGTTSKNLVPLPSPNVKEGQKVYLKVPYPAGTYTVSGNFTITQEDGTLVESPASTLTFYRALDDLQIHFELSGNGTPLTVTIPWEFKAYHVRAGRYGIDPSATNTINFTSLMMSPGSNNVLPYEPYGEQKYEITETTPMQIPQLPFVMYATEPMDIEISKYIPQYHLDTTLNAALDAIIAIQEELIGDSVTLITFTTPTGEYQAEEGMTWGEWIDSQYNIDGFIINGFGWVEDGDGGPIYDVADGGYPEESSYIIIAGHTYIYD